MKNYTRLIISVLVLGVMITFTTLNSTMNKTGNNNFLPPASISNRVVSLEQKMDEMSVNLSKLADSISNQNTLPSIDSMAISTTVVESNAHAESYEDNSEFEDLQTRSVKDLREMRKSLADKHQEKQNLERRLIQTTFASEEYDQMWSPNVTSRIETTFQLPEFSDDRLASVDCRTTMCKIEIQHSPNQSSDALYAFENVLLTKLAQDFSSGRLRQIPRPDGVRTELFLAAKGYSLAQLSNR